MNNDELILDNLKLINLSIKQMKLFWNTEDEYQEYYDAGLDGLINGARTYNSSIGKHSTYLVICIKNEIKRLLKNKTLVKHTNIYGKDISLYKELYDSEGKTMYLEDIVEDPNINIEEEVEQKIQLEEIISIIDDLDDFRIKEIIKYRYGLIDGKCYSYKEIGDKLNLSREAIRLKIEKGLRIIRKEYNCSHIKQFKIIGGNMGKNLNSLNDYLFEELERLNNNEIINDEDKLKKEIQRSTAMSKIATNIINNANVVVEVNKMFNKSNKVPDLLGIPKK